MYVLDGLVGKNYPEIDLGAHLPADASVSGFVKPLQIVRVNPAASPLEGNQASCRIEAECSIGLSRPVSDLPMNRVVRKAARVTESLRFSQIGFTSAQGFFGFFPIFDVGAGGKPSDYFPGFVAQRFASD